MENEDDAPLTGNFDDLDTMNVSGSYLTSSLTGPAWDYSSLTGAGAVGANGPTSGNYTVNVTNGGTGWTGAASSINNATYSYATTSFTPGTIQANGQLTCEGDADFKGDVKIKGKSIVDTLEAIEKHLSILTPNPKKLAKYEALKKAYEHYKILEAMCDEDDDDIK